MLSWPALLLAPLIALGELSVAYSLVSPSCASQHRGGLHALAGVSLLIVLAMTALAWHAWRRSSSSGANAGQAMGSRAAPRVTRADSGATEDRPHFVAQMAVVVGALSALVCLALWVPIWFLSPCY
jgi:hypothetical protein